VSVLSLLQAIVAIMIGRPDDAKGRPQDYIRDSDKRHSVFGHDDYDESSPSASEMVLARKPYDIKVYLNCLGIVRRVDAFLGKASYKLTNEDKRNIRFYLARYVACSIVRNAHCPPSEIAKIDLDKISDDLILPFFKRVKSLYRRHGGNDEAAKSPKLGRAFDRIMINTFSPPHSRRKAQFAS